MKFIKDIKTLATLLMAVVAFTACSSSSDDNIEQNTPLSPSTQKTYTLTIQATKGENALTRAIAAAGGEAKTRALDLDGATNTLNATWNEGEKVYVYSKANTSYKYGELQSAASSTGSTTLSGALTEHNQEPAIGKELKLYFPERTVSYSSQLGTIADIAAHRDYSTAEVTVLSRNDENNTITTTPATFTNHQAVVKFTLLDKSGNPVNAQSLTIVEPNNKLVTDRDEHGTSHGDVGSATITVTPTDATNVLYVAISSDGNAMNLTLTATTESGDTYTYEKSGVTFTNGNYYAITVKMTKQPAATGHATSSAVVGDIIGSDGLAYDGSAYDNLPTGVTAVAKVCFVYGNGSGLALAMHDEGQMDWSTAISTCEGKTPTVPGCTWKLAGEDEWLQMIYAADNDYTALRDGFSSVGGTNMQSGYYWTSTEDGEIEGSAFFFDFESSGCPSTNKYESNNVRACLVF